MIGSVTIISAYLILTNSFNTETLSLFNLGFDQFLYDSSYLLILGIISTSIAFVVSVGAMKKLTPFTVSISVNMEPIYAIILALLFFGEKEKMSFEFYIGVAIILGTILTNGILKKQKSKK